MNKFYIFLAFSFFLFSCESTEQNTDLNDEKTVASDGQVPESIALDDTSIIEGQSELILTEENPIEDNILIPEDGDSENEITTDSLLGEGAILQATENTEVTLVPDDSNIEETLGIEDEPEVEANDVIIEDALLEDVLALDDSIEPDTIINSENEALEESFGIVDEPIVELNDLSVIDPPLEILPETVEDVAIESAVANDLQENNSEEGTENFVADDAQVIEGEQEQGDEMLTADTIIDEPLLQETEPALDVSDAITEEIPLATTAAPVIEPLIENDIVLDTALEDEGALDTQVIDSDIIQEQESTEEPGIVNDTTTGSSSVQLEQDLLGEDFSEIEPIIDNEQPDTLDSVIITDSGDIIFENTNESDMLSYEHIAPITPPAEASQTQEYDEIRQPVTISQTVEAFIDNYVDITLPGQGWIYLGETNETTPPVLDFIARYIDGDDTLFNFYATNIGSTILHFYKQDVIADEYLDEYIEVVIQDFKTLSTPNRTTSRQSNAEEIFGISAEPEVALVSGGSEITEETVFIPEQLLDEAELALSEGRFGDSVSLLDEYTSLGVDEIDRALFLYGQNYESSSDQRNIRQALSSYEKIIDSFPDSDYWDEASKRITYLERFYLNIR